MSYSQTEIQEIQNRLRQSVLEKRLSLSAQEVEEKSELICKKFLQFLEKNATPQDFQDQIIALYRSKKPSDGELDPSCLLQSPLFSFAHFAFPRILSFTERKMDFAIPMHSSDWMLPKTQIPEPKPDLPSVNAEEISMILVPGVVFGSGGQRVGRGAGFYDRFLKQCAGAVRVGLAFDFQVSEELSDSALAPWDETLDILVTESDILEF